MSGIYNNPMDINVSKIQVMRSPKNEENLPVLTDSRENSQPILRKTKTDVKMNEEILPKSLQDPIISNPRLNENISTALEINADERANRRSPVIIKAYESVDQQIQKKRLFADQSSIYIENSVVNS